MTVLSFGMPDQPVYARLKGTGHGNTGTYIYIGDLRDKDTDIFYWDPELESHPKYRINLIDIDQQCGVLQKC